MKTPPHHQLLATQDGSLTLYNEKFQEGCHSTHGAKSETIFHYIEGCKIIDRLNAYDSPFSILEVGFGLGVGFETTLEKIPQDSFIRFISLEFDLELLQWYQDKSSLPLVWTKTLGVNALVAKTDRFELIILAGDARETIKVISPGSIHAIYQDAFSPKKNPLLWTVEWFNDLRKISHPDVYLSTYSSSLSIQKSLIEAGFKLNKGEAFGKKRSSTRARLVGETDSDIIVRLQRSPTPSLRDKDFL